MKLTLRTACLLFSFVFLAHAQPSPEAQEALRQGKTAAAQALNTYQTPNPDQPFWAAALAHGEEAERLAPGEPEPQRFLAQVYTSLGWFKRAYDAWETYERLGGDLDDDARSKYAQMSAALGYSRYMQGDLMAALADYQKAAELADDDSTLAWLALINFELGKPRAALPYWQRTSERQPDNPLYAVYLQRTRDQIAYGVEAGNAFYRGLTAYNQGEPEKALDAFAQAARLNPDYLDAVQRAGTLSLTLARPDAAVTYLQRALALAPDDAQVRDELALAQTQVRFGVQAVTHYQDGVRLLEQNRFTAAKDAFTAATLANGRFADAWAQLGRAERALGNLEAALQAFERAADLVPAETSYRQQASALKQMTRDRPAQVQGAAQDEPGASAEPVETSAQVESPSVSSPLSQEAEVTAPNTSPTGATPNTAQAADVLSGTSPAADPTKNAEQNGNTEPDGAPLTLLGVTFTHYGEAGNQEAAFSFFEQPTLTFDFYNPLDYAEGTLYQRLEVFSKPSDAVVQYQVCLVPADDITVAPACSDSADLTFEGRGTFEAEQPLKTLSNYRKIDWSRGLASILLVLRDSYGNPVSSGYLSESSPSLSFSDYYPMRVSYSAVIVPPDGVFSGWPEQLTDR